MSPHSDLVGLILMGGRSTRLGEDKSQLKIGDEFIYSILNKLLLRYCPEVIMSVRTTPSIETNIPFITDSTPDKGPLEGIYTALKTTKRSLLILSVDMPFVNDEMIEELLENRKCDYTGFKINNEESLQPFPGIWEYELIEKLFNNRMQSNQSVIKFLGDQKTNLVLTEKSENWININTPEDFRKFQQLIGE